MINKYRKHLYKYSYIYIYIFIHIHIKAHINIQFFLTGRSLWKDSFDV